LHHLGCRARTGRCRMAEVCDREDRERARASSKYHEAIGAVPGCANFTKVSPDHQSPTTGTMLMKDVDDDENPPTNADDEPPLSQWGRDLVAMDAVVKPPAAPRARTAGSQQAGSARRSPVRSNTPPVDPVVSVQWCCGHPGWSPRASGLTQRGPPTLRRLGYKQSSSNRKVPPSASAGQCYALRGIDTSVWPKSIHGHGQNHVDPRDI